MAYIGSQPTVGNFQACDAISATATTTFNLTVGNVAISPQSAQHCLVSLNGVLQAPISSYTISGSTIIFAAALTTDDSIDFITVLGDVLDLGVPSDDTVGAAQIKADLISGTTALAAEPADTDEFLVSDAGVLKRIDYSLIKGGGITEADNWRLTTNFSGDAAPIASNWERGDTDGAGYFGTGMSQSSGIFTFPSTGYWYITYTALFLLGSGADSAYQSISMLTTLNNSSYSLASGANTFVNGVGSGNTFSSGVTSFIFDVTDTTNRKVRFDTDSANTSTVTIGSTAEDQTSVKFIRLGDT